MDRSELNNLEEYSSYVCMVIALQIELPNLRVFDKERPKER